MKNEELINNLSEEVKQKLSACKTKEELKEVLAEAGVELLDDDLVESVAGGGRVQYSMADKPDFPDASTFLQPIK